MSLRKVKINNKYGFIDETAGKLVVPCVYDGAYPFIDGLALVRKGNKLGYVNETGKEIVPFVYDYVGTFSDGVVDVRKGNQFGYIDQFGKEIVPIGKYSVVWPFHNGLGTVRLNGKKLYVDITGKEVDKREESSEGLMEVKNDDKGGYEDQNGKEVSLCLYEETRPFSEGLAAVKKDGKWGYIDKTGKEIIPFIYDEALAFSDGLAAVCKNGKWGYINNIGKVVIPFKYDRANSFKNGLAEVWENQPPHKEKAFRSGTITVWDKEGRHVWSKYYWGYIDKNGKEIIPLCPYIIDDNSAQEAWAFGTAAVIEYGDMHALKETYEANYKIKHAKNEEEINEIIRWYNDCIRGEIGFIDQESCAAEEEYGVEDNVSVSELSKKNNLLERIDKLAQNSIIEIQEIAEEYLNARKTGIYYSAL